MNDPFKALKTLLCNWQIFGGMKKSFSRKRDKNVVWFLLKHKNAMYNLSCTQFTWMWHFLLLSYIYAINPEGKEKQAFFNKLLFNSSLCNSLKRVHHIRHFSKNKKCICYLKRLLLGNRGVRQTLFGHLYGIVLGQASYGTCQVINGLDLPLFQRFLLSPHVQFPLLQLQV